MIFSDAVHEVYYIAQGLSFQQDLIDFLKSYPVFKWSLYLIYGSVMMGLLLGINKRNNEGFFFIKKRHFSISSLLTYLICFVLGISILVPSTDFNVLKVSKEIWSKDSKYSGTYKTSWLFDVIVSPIEIVTKDLSLWANKYDRKVNPNQLRAIFAAGLSVIDNPELLSKLDGFVDDCVMPKLSKEILKPEEIDNLFILRSIFRDRECNQKRDLIESKLSSFVSQKISFFKQYIPLSGSPKFARASLLGNYYAERSGADGLIHKVADKNTAHHLTYVSKNGVLDYLSQVFRHFDFFDQGVDWAQGGFSARQASALELSEKMKRAPILKGYAKMFLIILFVFLPIPLVAGRWQFLISWALVYFSVCLWEPIWSFMFYQYDSLHNALDIFLGDSSYQNIDTISIFGAHMIKKSLNYHYSVYACIMIWIGPSLTLITAGAFALPLLKSVDSAPDPATSSIASHVGGIAGTIAGPMGSVGGAVLGGLSSKEGNRNG